MEFAYLLSGVLVGIITGLLIGALRWKSQLSTVKAEVEAERDAAKLINANASEMSDRFKSLAAESLKSNSESFLTRSLRSKTSAADGIACLHCS